MKVRAKVWLKRGGDWVRPGTEFEAEEQDAQHMVLTGSAEPCEAPQPAAPEEALREEPKRSVKRSRKR